MFGIANEGKWKLIFLNEFLMRPGIMCANPDHYIPLCKKAFVIIAQAAGFVGATWCGIFRINIKYNLFSF